LVQRIPWAVDS